MNRGIIDWPPNLSVTISAIKSLRLFSESENSRGL